MKTIPEIVKYIRVSVMENMEVNENYFRLEKACDELTNTHNTILNQLDRISKGYYYENRSVQ